jgi:hypothetical protein
MFRQQMCHPQGAYFVTLLNYIITIAAFIKINKSLKHFVGSSVVSFHFDVEVFWRQSFGFTYFIEPNSCIRFQ